MALSNMKAMQAGSTAQARQTAIAPAPLRVPATTRRATHSLPAQSVPSVRGVPASQPRTARKHIVPSAAAVEVPPIQKLS